jgi:mono/diheme cytochrome c family protein
MSWLFVGPLALVTLLGSAAAAPRYSRDVEVARSKLRNGQPVTENNIRLVIEKGRDGMPSFSQTLSPQQMDQLIAYLKEL